ncbi:hypothetical protein [Pleionea sediminis]|uniref:amino acid kinase family protein n=1 Tax=Pleionea sediminis TaxID=2569479 RepID=UPI001186D574|nr:hypothetical protein [Pleionea sediminis]
MLLQNQNVYEQPFRQLTLPKSIIKIDSVSIESAGCFLKVAQFIKDNLSSNDLVVLSSSGDTKKSLMQLCNDEKSATDKLDSVIIHHKTIIKGCLPLNSQNQVLKSFDQDCLWIKHLIEINRVQQHQEEIIAFGEIWSAKILTAILESDGVDASWIDSRRFIKLQKLNGQYAVDILQSKKYYCEHQKSRQNRLSIVTSSIAGDCECRTLSLECCKNEKNLNTLSAIVDAEKISFYEQLVSKDIFSNKNNTIQFKH